MKPIKKILVGLIGFFVIASLLLALTGNSHLFKGVPNTYLVGKSGPGIDDMDIFHSRKITKGIHQPWPESREINQKILDQKYLTEFASYESIAFLVIKKGEIQTEMYWDDYNASSKTNSFSPQFLSISCTVFLALRWRRFFFFG